MHDLNTTVDHNVQQKIYTNCSRQSFMLMTTLEQKKNGLTKNGFKQTYHTVCSNWLITIVHFFWSSLRVMSKVQILNIKVIEALWCVNLWHN